MIIILTSPATKSDIENALQHYPNYIKITIDINKEIIAIGGEYHFDAEQHLLTKGCNQEDIWGGGLEISTKTLETIAMINVRPRQNAGQDIINIEIKKKFLKIAYKYLTNYANAPELLS